MVARTGLALRCLAVNTYFLDAQHGPYPFGLCGPRWYPIYGISTACRPRLQCKLSVRRGSKATASKEYLRTSGWRGWQNQRVRPARAGNGGTIPYTGRGKLNRRAQLPLLRNPQPGPGGEWLLWHTVRRSRPFGGTGVVPALFYCPSWGDSSPAPGTHTHMLPTPAL